MYLGEKHTISRIENKAFSIFGQLELNPYSTEQIMTRSEKKELTQKGHPQYILEIIDKFLIAYNEDESKKDISQWIEIMNRFQKYGNKYEEILYYFKDEVDKEHFTDYLSLVEHEMYMSLINKRLSNGFYNCTKGIQRDLDNILDNAIKFNIENSLVIKFVRFLIEMCEILLQRDFTEEDEQIFDQKFDSVKINEDKMDTTQEKVDTAKGI